MTRLFGAEDMHEDADWYDADPHRHCPADVKCQHEKADTDWAGTLAALDGEAGVSIYDRKDLDDEAWSNDWRWPE